MQSVFVAFVTVALAVGAYFGHQLWLAQTGPTMEDKVRRELTLNEEFVKHSQHFNKKEVVKVTDNIYVAIGFALGNSIMVIAPEGLIIVDVTESVTAATEILKEFRKITNKPLKAIVYTHHHTDHMGGAQGFLEEGTEKPEVWSHYKLPGEVASFFTTSYGAKVRRSARQFGAQIPKSDQVNSGLGLFLRYDSHGYLAPNKMTTDKETFANIAGIAHSENPGYSMVKWRESGRKEFHKAFPTIVLHRWNTHGDNRWGAIWNSCRAGGR